MSLFETKHCLYLFLCQNKSSGILKQSQKPGHVRRTSQVKRDLLLREVKYLLWNTVLCYIIERLTDNHVFQELLDNKLSASEDSLSDNTNTKVSIVSQITFKIKLLVLWRFF